MKGAWRDPSATFHYQGPLPVLFPEVSSYATIASRHPPSRSLDLLASAVRKAVLADGKLSERVGRMVEPEDTAVALSTPRDVERNLIVH